MRPLLDMDTIQIEITNACVLKCSNCTRFCGHHPKPYFMSMKEAKRAIDSMKTYPKMTGLMGGEPLLHPKFKEICEYMQTVIPRERAGLWTVLPKGKEHLREVIVRTFGHIFINDHSRNDILHAPILVASEEIPVAQWRKDYAINSCWVQMGWSASINPQGAWFCEVAGALAQLLGIKDLGWEVEDYWWARSPKHFVAQMEMCKLCGCALPLKRRTSTEQIDDISPGMYERLKDISPKVKAGLYEIHDLQTCKDERPMATYKDQKYRDAIAKRYGIFLMANTNGFLTPFLSKNYTPPK